MMLICEFYANNANCEYKIISNSQIGISFVDSHHIIYG